MPATESLAITPDDVRGAHERIRPLAHVTPVMTSRLFNAEAGVEAFFKCENFQRAGAFKIRGAANFLRLIPAGDRPRGVVAFSSGNHAQAVSLAARELGMTATIVMPTDAPASKLAGTRAYGGNVVLYDRLTEDREAIGRRIAEETGATLVPPFDHPWIIAGQGTAALELMQQVDDLDAMVVCVGGGGLISGCATIAKELNRQIRVFGAEPELGNDTYLSFRAGHPVSIPPPATIADGLRSPRPGNLTFAIVKELVEDIVLVSEEEIIAAMQFMETRMKIVAEASGAVAAAVVMQRKLPPAVKRVGVIVSGGNR